MKIDAVIAPESLLDVPQITRKAEEAGFDGLWMSETRHDPFLPLGLVAEHSSKLAFGTAVAIGLVRSPAALAHTAWDLSRASDGRFILGLGTQVQAHVERRFGMPWPESPLDQTRELIGATRAFWQTWQHGKRLNFRGKHYKVTLMSDFFNPGPIEHPEIPIYLAAVNSGMCRLAGEVADGLHIHPLHSRRYLEQVLRPAFFEGIKRRGAQSDRHQLSATVMVVTDGEMEMMVREQIAFYASTPGYRAVMDLHGWQDQAEQLSQLVRRRKWQEMTAVVSDEMLETIAVVAPPDRLGAALQERYTDLVDRLTLYLPYPSDSSAFPWQQVLAHFGRPD